MALTGLYVQRLRETTGLDLWNTVHVCTHVFVTQYVRGYVLKIKDQIRGTLDVNIEHHLTFMATMAVRSNTYIYACAY